MTVRFGIPAVGSSPICSARRGFNVVELLLVVAILALLIMLLLPFMAKVSDQNYTVTFCMNSMKQLAMATENYHTVNGHYPPGTVAGSARKPTDRLSCLTELLPYVEAQSVYMSLDRGRSWKAESNKDAVSRPMKVFLCPSYGGSGNEHANHTSYAGIAGAGSDAAYLPISDPRCGIFGYDRTVRVEDVKDGLANTLLFLETRRDTGPWAAGGPATVRGIEPDDEPLIGPGCAFGLHFGEKRWFVGRRKTSAMAAMADGSVHAIGSGTNAEVLAALATIAGSDNNGLWIDW